MAVETRATLRSRPQTVPSTETPDYRYNVTRRRTKAGLGFPEDEGSAAPRLPRLVRKISYGSHTCEGNARAIARRDQELPTVWKWLLGLFVIAVVACGVGGYFLGTSPNVKEWAKQFNPEEKITEVKLEPVVRGKLSKVVSAPGRVEPKTKVEISAQVAAR